MAPTSQPRMKPSTTPPTHSSPSTTTTPTPPLPPRLIHTLTTFPYISHLRTLLIIIFPDTHNYCQTCSPRRSTIPCLPTCPLLRPADKKPGPRLICPYWLNQSRYDNALYGGLVADIKENGRGASKERVKAWEGMAERLRVSGMSELERKFEEGRMVVDVRGVVGMEAEWVFEGRWGKRLEEEDMVAPDEDVGRGRKRTREDESSGREGKRVKVPREKEKNYATEQRKERVMKRAKEKAKVTVADAGVGPSGKTRKRGRAVDEDLKRREKRQRDDCQETGSGRKKVRIVIEQEIKEEKRKSVVTRAKSEAKVVVTDTDNAPSRKTKK